MSASLPRQAAFARSMCVGPFIAGVMLRQMMYGGSRLACSGGRRGTPRWPTTAFSRARTDSVLSCSGGARHGRTAVIKEYRWFSKDEVGLAGGSAP
jgi:hypothetical protein